MAAAMILDDSSYIFKSEPPPTQNPNDNYFDGSASVLIPAPFNPEAGMLLFVSFSGTSITLFGDIGSNVSATLRIDEEEQSEIHFVAQGQSSISYVIYQSPSLSDAAKGHSLIFNFSSADTAIVLDYAVVSLSENTAINGERLIVDEIDPSIAFVGDWVKNTSMLGYPSKNIIRRPYGNTTHQTSSSRASATFRFNGTSVFVFGAKFLSPSQSLVVMYTVDEVETASDSKIYSSGNLTNFQWYQKDGLSPSNHTLNITIMDVSNNASFILDYLLYTPSFSSLAEEKGLFNQEASSSISPSKPSSQATGPQVSIVPPPNQPGTSRGTLIGAIIGPVLFVAVLVILLVMRRRKLFFWSSRKRFNPVVPFPPPSQNQGFSQLHVYYKSSTTNGQNIQIPIPEHDLPLAGPSATSDGVPHTHRRARWWVRIWRRSRPRILEAFPPNWNPSSSIRSMVQRKPPFPSTYAQRQTSRQSATSSTNETIVADPRVQQLEELVVSLQQEIEETRQVYGAQNGALMRELVEGHSETANQHSQQENHDDSMTMSATVV